jgi:hypothetical protein
MTQPRVFFGLCAGVIAAGCATTVQPLADFPADRFVALSCADGKVFQVRRSPDSRTLRVRSHHGSAELERQADGRYVGDGYTLDVKDSAAVSLDHAGKSQGTGCKRTA